MQLWGQIYRFPRSILVHSSLIDKLYILLYSTEKTRKNTMFDTTTSQHWWSASSKSTPSTPESWGLRMVVMARCETVTASLWCMGLGVLRHSFLPNKPKINCNKNTNNDKCSLPVIVAELLSHRKSPATTAARNGTLHLCFLYNFRLKTISAAPRLAPASGPQGLRGWLTWLYAARCLDFLLQIAFWNFSVW